jgi:hypothetical protein
VDDNSHAERAACQASETCLQNVGKNRLELAVPNCLKTVSAPAVVMQEKTTSPAKKPENGQINKAPLKPPVQAHQTAHYLVELMLVLVACFLGVASHLQGLIAAAQRRAGSRC